jgi:hypothetical protein
MASALMEQFTRQKWWVPEAMTPYTRVCGHPFHPACTSAVFCHPTSSTLVNQLRATPPCLAGCRMGQDFLALTSRDGLREMTILDPLIMHTVMHRAGMVSDSAVGAAGEYVARIWHLAVFTPAAFFNSPRGRWAMRFMSMVAFICLYTKVGVHP